MPLEDYYLGDKDWNDFVSVHIHKSMSGETYIGNENIFYSLGQLDNTVIEFLTIAVSLFGLRRTLKWLNTKIPALENETPLYCISEAQHSTAMRNRMRVYFMRFPV